MPIFQAATSGYRDPLKAMTIKALEDRQKAAALETARSAQPVPVATPMGGLAHIADILGSQMQEGRAAGALASNREALAGIMAGINQDTGPTSEQIAQVNQRDPELAKNMYEEAMRSRREKAAAQAQRDFTHGENELTRGQQTTLQNDQQQAQADAARLEAENAVRTATTLAERQAAEKRLEELSTANLQKADDVRASEEAQRKEGLPQTSQGKIEQDFRNGAYGDPSTPEAQKLRDDAMAKENTVTGGFTGPAGLKAITDWRSKANGIDTNLDAMHEALQLTPKVLQGDIATQALDFAAKGGSLGLAGLQKLSALAGFPITQENINATQRYRQIMDLNAMTQMSTLLAGSDSDRDVQNFRRILADPNATLANKQTAIQGMIISLKKERDVVNSSLVGSGQQSLNPYKDPEAPAASTSSDSAAPASSSGDGGGASAEPAPPAAQPGDEEGATGSRDGIRYIFRNGKWVRL